MGNNICFIILALLIQFLDVCSSCKNIAMRKKGSPEPIAELSFSPDEDRFAVNSSFNVICTGKKSDSPSFDDKYLIPGVMNLFLHDTAIPVPCHYFNNDTRHVKTCVLKVRRTKAETLVVTCQVHNFKCSYHQKTIHIQEQEKPHLIKQPPRRINVTEKQDLNITCISLVVPRPIITWYKDDVIVTNQKITWYRGTSVLMLKSMDSSFQGKYTCKAVNSLGEIESNPSFITVFSRPRISLGPVNQSVAIGYRVSMFCNVTGLPIPVIGWIKDGVVLGSGTRSDEAVKVLQSSLAMSNISVAVNDTAPNITSSMSSALPQARYTRNTTSIPDVNSTVTGPIPPWTFSRHNTLFTSTITRSIAPTSIVTRPTPPAQRPFPGKITQKGRQSIFVIDSVTKADEGNYQCYAMNTLGNTTSLQAVFSVYILEKPRFVVSPANVSVLAGFNATMKCTAIGHPAPNITWYKNMLPVTKGRRLYVVTNGNTSVLLVTFVVRQDEGVYRCKAENSFGTHYSAQAFLNVTADDVQPNAAARNSSGTNPIILILGTVLPLLLIIMVAMLIVVKRKRKSHQNSKEKTSNTVAQKDKELDGIKNEAMDKEEFLDDFVYLLLMEIDRDWEISRDRLKLTNQRLGAGCFGQVEKAIYTRKNGKEMFVAVKTLKDPEIKSHRDDLLAELEMLKRVGRHPNIVSLVGACTRDDPMCVVIEFVEGGSLNELLLKARLPTNREKPYENIKSRLNDRELIKIASEIAQGMSHLHEKNCIHRDLAARNILIGKGLVAKIADFGLARHMTDGFYIKQSSGKVPWKWMAPEALQGLFTAKSDVWSFGILLWEIATLGDLPYPAVTQLVVLYNLLLNGFRMNKPPHCDQLLYSVMMDCWSADASKRPEFDDIHERLEKMLNQKERIYINLEEMDLENIEHTF